MSYRLIFWALLLAAPAQDSEDLRIQRWVVSLDSEDAKAREEAETRLLQLGRPIRPLLVRALPRLSAEQKGRIEAILQRFALEEEEEFALATLRKGLPFPLPPPPRGPVGVPVTIETGIPLADAISAIGRRFNLKIEIFPANTALCREAERANVITGSTSENGDAEALLWTALISTLDACYVLDGDRIVIVRMTPNLLLERVARESAAEKGFEIETRLAEFEGRWNRPGMTAASFLGCCYGQGGARFARWQDALISIARDTRRPVPAREAALTGLRCFRGMDGEPQSEATDAMLQIARDEKAPIAVRAQAGSALAYCVDEDAQEEVLALLEQGDAMFARPLLARLVKRNQSFQSALNRIEQDKERSARLVSALRKLERSAEPDLALRSLIVHAIFTRDAVTLQRFAQARTPSDPQTLRLFLEGLRVSAFKQLPEIRDRVDRLAAEPSPGLRAAAGAIYGYSVGGTERARDVQGGLRLLQDPEPLVRWSAAESLRYIYMIEGAAEPYTDDWDAIEERLKTALGVEAHPQVRKALETALARK